MKPRLNRTRNGLIAALDVGTSKIACFIARIEDGGLIRVLGIGHHASDGVRFGMITEVESAESAILATVHAAEQMAGETINEVITSSITKSRSRDTRWATATSARFWPKATPPAHPATAN
jgi:cell division ATPase FtsA